MSMLNLPDETLNKAIVDGIKDTLVSEIKLYMEKEIDNALNEIALEISKRIVLRANERLEMLTDQKVLRLELFYNCPTGNYRYEVETTSVAKQIHE